MEKQWPTCNFCPNEADYSIIIPARGPNGVYHCKECAAELQAQQLAQMPVTSSLDGFTLKFERKDSLGNYFGAYLQGFGAFTIPVTAKTDCRGITDVSFDFRGKSYRANENRGQFTVLCDFEKAYAL